jgi:hypothetical protein
MEAVAIFPPATMESVAIIKPKNMVPASPTIQARRTSKRQKTKSVGIKIVRIESTKIELFSEARVVSVR